MRVRSAIRVVLSAGISFLLAGSAFAADQTRQCGTRSDAQYARLIEDIGGRHITARGTLRVLVVFASFPDDETPHPYWPAHNPPLFMQQFIDPDTTTNSQSPYNLTNYFHQMSLGQFHFVGDAIWVETPHSQEEYRSGAYGRANKNVLQERVDSLVDFTRYDAWTKLADYSHVNAPDSLVDMIIMVWRTNIFEFIGEASLGYTTGFRVDGKKIEMGFPEYLPRPSGSGVTCEYLYTDSPYRVMQTMVHEVGHWLLGGPHPYNNESLHGKHIYWGILCNGLRAASCANAYERERLGWIAVPEIPPDQTIALTDFLTTGVAYKYHPPNGEAFEYFYIENHQKLSVFDDATSNLDDKGVWILHQEGPYLELDNLKIKPSDGNWRWENPSATLNCFSQSLPVFRKGVPRIGSGESHRDQIPNSSSAVNWMLVYQDPAGQLNCGRFYTGELFTGAFSVTSAPVFSPYSNPNTNTWGNHQTAFTLETLNQLNDVITIRLHSNPLNAPPARRYLGVDPTAGTRQPDWIYLGWGEQWVEGQPLEADVNWSELERKIGNGGDWISIYAGTARNWSDASVPYDTNGTVPVLFRARVRDTQGKYSAWSNIFYTATEPTNSVANLRRDAGEIPDDYELGSNYPNPFNPSTQIRLSLPKSDIVTLDVYDILGRLVARVIDSQQLNAGTYHVMWDGKDKNGSHVSAGVYLYKVQTNSFAATKKMLLLK